MPRRNSTLQSGENNVNYRAESFEPVESSSYGSEEVSTRVCNTARPKLGRPLER